MQLILTSALISVLLLVAGLIVFRRLSARS